MISRETAAVVCAALKVALGPPPEVLQRARELDAARARHAALARAGVAIDPRAGAVWYKAHGETEWREIGGTAGPIKITIEREDPGEAFLRGFLSGSVSIATPYLDVEIADFVPWRKRMVACRPRPKRRPKLRRKPLARAAITLPAPLPVKSGDQVRVDIPPLRVGQYKHPAFPVSDDDLVSDTLDLKRMADERARPHSADGVWQHTPGEFVQEPEPLKECIA
jgi:hypothetical protein